MPPEPDVAWDVEMKYYIDHPLSLHFTVCALPLLMALFQVAKQNYANVRQKSEP